MLSILWFVQDVLTTELSQKQSKIGLSQSYLKFSDKQLYIKI